jgi:hypothetical protein
MGQVAGSRLAAVPSDMLQVYRPISLSETAVERMIGAGTATPPFLCALGYRSSQRLFEQLVKIPLLEAVGVICFTHACGNAIFGSEMFSGCSQAGAKQPS